MQSEHNTDKAAAPCFNTAPRQNSHISKETGGDPIPARDPLIRAPGTAGLRAFPNTPRVEISSGPINNTPLSAQEDGYRSHAKQNSEVSLLWNGQRCSDCRLSPETQHRALGLHTLTPTPSCPSPPKPALKGYFPLRPKSSRLTFVPTCQVRPASRTASSYLAAGISSCVRAPRYQRSVVMAFRGEGDERESARCPGTKDGKQPPTPRPLLNNRDWQPTVVQFPFNSGNPVRSFTIFDDRLYFSTLRPPLKRILI
ncbi:hypothetical protein AAFF_G00376390 [Aldrovandia affinis]|uniref:Uncharacterized protein n=1 Tax=Aldrovandia affinis TaxID=143900 RepID=A0AAD7WM00_9TELE|nr:hypothetical protein AAFF_G00376390 [Aldrovandia affinis]